MIYNINGSLIGIKDNNVYISYLKEMYPSYNDDQLMGAAISIAKQNGPASKIIWDGTDINFSGSVTHECKGFGGIDFNGSNIIMPNYNGGIILNVIPDETKTVKVQYSDITKEKTSNSNLLGKIFTLNRGGSNDAPGTNLGTRQPTDTFGTPVYWAPTVKTGIDGYYETGSLFLTPTSGEISCYNIHNYPAICFEICNGTVITSQTTNISKLLNCNRSHTHLHDFVLKNRSDTPNYGDGLFTFAYCYDIEVDHISGVNPTQESLNSGYFLLVGSVTNLYVHDCFVGDSISWGSMGANHLVNTVTERCYLNRWDCHYCQTGYNVIRDCVLNRLEYGAGDGVIRIENCTFQNNKTSSNMIYSIRLREDLVGVYEGSVIVDGCEFYRGEQSESLYTPWMDKCGYAKPADSDLPVNPFGKRFFEKCKIPDGCNNVIIIGTNTSADIGMFENVHVTIKDSEVNCSDTILESAGANQNVIGGIIVEGCIIQNQCYVTKLLTDTPVKVCKCDFGTNALKIISNSEELYVTDTKLANITADASSAKLVANGNVFSSTQSVSRFSTYALSGNIAPDMASVNKHS